MYTRPVDVIGLVFIKTWACLIIVHPVYVGKKMMGKVQQDENIELSIASGYHHHPSQQLKVRLLHRCVELSF